jgi:hypothetical protein
VYPALFVTWTAPPPDATVDESVRVTFQQTITDCAAQGGTMRRVTRIAHCRSGAANLRFQLTTAKVTNKINNIAANLQKTNR